MMKKIYLVYDPLDEFDEIYKMGKDEVIAFAHAEVSYTDYPYTKFKTVENALRFLEIYGFEILNVKIKKEQSYDIEEWLQKYNKDYKLKGLHRLLKKGFRK